MSAPGTQEASRSRLAAIGSEVRGRVEQPAHDLLGDGAAAVLLTRLDHRLPDVVEALDRVYGDHDLVDLLVDLLDVVLAAAAARSPELRLLDHRREIGQQWWLSERVVGYVAYTDRFAGTLAGLLDRIDYLEELGVTYLHLLPLLEPREGENDGGYAVKSYRRVDPALGDMDDLERLAARLRERGVSLCVDLVVNHTAREHAWAQAAMDGDPVYRDYYRLFPDREAPDAYERTLWEVFPDLAPGNFTWVDELDAWVWTSFYPYQWDLNYENPAVFREMLEIILELANRGVEVLRLDAVPFLWKRVGTLCQNLPETHALLQAWRGLAAIAAPATIFKAEAIVAPGDLVRYLGRHERHRPECQLAYNNQLMVLGWSALATRSADLIHHALERMGQTPPTTTWVTYVRNHDDIGWAVSDEDADAVGVTGQGHRGFLSDFYAGDFPGSFARGARFGVHDATGDARTSGTTASLAGVQAALESGDEEELDLAIRRVLLLHALAASWGGIPLVWSGDELAALNDPDWRDEASREGDNRWMHRPRLDWDVAERRHTPGTVEQRVFDGLRKVLAARAGLPMLGGDAPSHPWDVDNPRVFAFARDHPRHGLAVVLANVSEERQSVDAAVLGAFDAPTRDALSDEDAGVHGGRVFLEPYQVRWMVAA